MHRLRRADQEHFGGSIKSVLLVQHKLILKTSVVVVKVAVAALEWAAVLLKVVQLLEPASRQSYAGEMK